MSVTDWAPALPPSLADFETLCETAVGMIPEALREHCAEVVIQVADFADDDTLASLDLDDPFTLTGVYIGVDLTQKSTADTPAGPDLVYLYRRPILDEWAERGTIALGDLIAHVLIHEIAHHFGYSDAQIEALQA